MVCRPYKTTRLDENGEGGQVRGRDRIRGIDIFIGWDGTKLVFFKNR